MTERRVVVTGLGVVAANGIGEEAFWAANRAGRSGLSRLDVFPSDEFPTKVAGQIRDFEPAQFMPPEITKRVDRFVHFGLACAEMARQASRLDLDAERRESIGVILGSGLGGQLF